MAQAQINTKNLSFGAGRLFFARADDAAATLPKSHTEALTSAWEPIGATKEGSEISFEITREPVEVAERMFAVAHVTTSQKGSIKFELAENTVRNLTLAMNGGKVETYGQGADAGFSYTPPEPGQEREIKLVWESDQGDERWVFPKLSQSSAFSMSRKKGADIATLPVEFEIELGNDGAAPFTAFYAAARAGVDGFGGATSGEAIPPLGNMGL